MFAFQVEYLSGRVFAGDFRDRAEPEWPPHPSRLFSALVAACHETRMGDRARQALLWLEKQPPPSVWAARRGESNRVSCYVPTNYVESGAKNALQVLPTQRKKRLRPFPSHAPEKGSVYFLWPSAEPGPESRAILQETAHRIAYLGKASSLVRITLADLTPQPNYVPDESGEHVLRVPAEGRLAELEEAFALNRWPPVGPQRRYRQLGEPVLQPEPVHGVFSELLVFRRVSGIRLTVEATLTLTTALRAAMLKLADQHGLLTDRLHGHGTHPHCAFVSLAFVGHPHADGRVMGLGMALPAELTDQERQKILAAAGRLEHVCLQRQLGVWRVAPVLDAGPISQSLHSLTWTQAAIRWSTVTPILLDRFPKEKQEGRRAVEVIVTSCERIGIPRPISVEYGPYSAWKGVPPVPQFRLLRRPEDRPRWAVHATLTFKDPVRGPLLLGAGRYFGMGLMRPHLTESAL